MVSLMRSIIPVHLIVYRITNAFLRRAMVLASSNCTTCIAPLSPGPHSQREEVSVALSLNPVFCEAPRAQLLVSNEGILGGLLNGRAQFLVLISTVNLWQRCQGDQKTYLEHKEHRLRGISLSFLDQMALLHVSLIITKVLYFQQNVLVCDLLCGLVATVSGCRPRGPGFDSRRYQIF
jgi:hypothetical protein